MTAMLYPDWNILADFVKRETAGAMHSDSLLSTHPIDVIVNSPDEIAQIFDAISYGKGASVIRMMEAFVGEDSFQRGVSNYLKEYSFGNAEGKDLWRHLEKVSKQPVSAMMESWIKRPGYPVVTVQKKESKLTLKQDRFLLSGRELKDEPPWPIPLTMKLNGETRRLSFDTRTRDIPLDSKLEHLKLNIEQTGFYRVLYDQDLYALIGHEFGKLSPLDRWGILSDLFSFVLAGRRATHLYLNFVKQCLEETEYIVVDSISDQLQLLRLIAPSNHEVVEGYSSFFRSQARRLSLGQKPEEKETDKILRGRIFAGLALIDDPEFSVELSDQFARYENVDPNLRTAVAIAYARREGSDAFEPMVAMMKKLGSEADVIKIYAGLTSFKDQELVRRALDLSVSGEISRADSVYAIGSAVLQSICTVTLPGTGSLPTFKS